MKYATPWTFQDQWGGQHTLNPGDMWGDMMFVAKMDGVYYTQGNALFQIDEGTFIRDLYLSAVAKGVAKAEWLVPLLKAEMTFCMALVGTMAMVIGTIAAVSVGVGKGVSFYIKHRTIIKAAIPLLERVLAGLKYFKSRCPKLYKFMRDNALKNAAASIPQGVSLDDVAYFMGKLIGGLASGGDLGLKLLGKSLAMASGLLIGLRGIPMAARGSVKNVKEFVEKARQGGVTVSEADARELIQETCLADHISERTFKDLVDAANKVQPMLEQLAVAAKAL